jgi:quinoprotein glucose dehydrogenase
MSESGRLPRALWVAAAAALLFCGGSRAGTRFYQSNASGGEWSAYAGSNASDKYSPLDQISVAKVTQLRIAWRWKSPDLEILRRHPQLTTWKFEATPIMIGGVLYTSTSLSQVAAIEAGTGHTLWVYDPQSYSATAPPNFGFVHRGVAYWTDQHDTRIFIGTGDAYLVALDAKTGKPVSTFGKNGRIDLTSGLTRPVDRVLYGVNSPPLICKNVVIVGSTVVDYPKEKVMPPGDVRGFDARSGRLLWTFHTIPMGGEYGSETWLSESWKEFGAANVWPPMSADDALGYVYLPVSSPASDFYGGRRPGNGLFGETLVCLDALTGKRIWHFQLVHHGLWDRDPPAAPILADIRSGNSLVRAVAQVSKQGFVYVFDRVSGQPMWPIEESISRLRCGERRKRSCASSIMAHSSCRLQSGTRSSCPDFEVGRAGQAPRMIRNLVSCIYRQ